MPWLLFSLYYLCRYTAIVRAVIGGTAVLLIEEHISAGIQDVAMAARIISTVRAGAPEQLHRSQKAIIKNPNKSSPVQTTSVIAAR